MLCQASLVITSIFEKGKDFTKISFLKEYFLFVFERNVNAETLATSTQNKNNEENKKVQNLEKLSSRNCEIEKLCYTRKVFSAKHSVKDTLMDILSKSQEKNCIRYRLES